MPAVDTLSTARRLTAEQNPAATAEGLGRRECSIHRIGSRNVSTPATQPILSVSLLAIPGCATAVPRRPRSGRVVEDVENCPLSLIHRQFGSGSARGRHDQWTAVDSEGHAEEWRHESPRPVAKSRRAGAIASQPQARRAPRALRTGFRSTPMPETSTSQTSPCFIALVEPGVPV